MTEASPFIDLYLHIVLIQPDSIIRYYEIKRLITFLIKHIVLEVTKNGK